jgi:hypothetical protein
MIFIKRLFLVVLFMWTSAPAQSPTSERSHASNPHCSAPPYGDTVANFKAFIAKYQAIDATSMVSILEHTCRAKFAGGDRRPLYTVGLTDQEIDAGSTAAVASTWMDTTIRALGSSPSPRTEPQTAAPSPSPGGYQSVTVEDFVSDGPKLAAEHVRVRLVGSYVLKGNVPVLFANMQQLLLTIRSPETSTYPSVPLLTDGAPSTLRRALISCDTDPSARQLGCEIGIQGNAVMCSVTNVFGASQRNVPCVEVLDGERWKPHPPTPEQLQQAKAADEAKEAEEVKEAIQASKKLIFRGQRVEYCMEQLSGAGYGHGDLNLIATACGSGTVDQCIKQVSLGERLSGNPDPVAAASAACEQAHAHNQQAFTTKSSAK